MDRAQNLLHFASRNFKYCFNIRVETFEVLAETGQLRAIVAEILEPSNGREILCVSDS